MCGLAGIVTAGSVGREQLELVARMSETIRHRGPDDSGVWSTDRVALGHRRLSIIDLSGGHQPMTSRSTRRTIAFNGEIYNYRDIMERLDPQLLATRSDTEVLMVAADVKSTSWLHELNGMFAFALWDEDERTLMLARDRHGIKPLYYRRFGGELVFASEIKALLEDRRYSRRLNEEAAWEYLQFRNVAGPQTMFDGIHELPPGHVALVKPDTEGFSIERWWKDNSDGGEVSDPRELSDRLSDAVRYHMIADVEVGTYNSGGVDSSLVSHFASGILDRQLHTFSVGFKESAFDESRYSGIVSGVIGSNHHRIEIDSKQYVENLERTIWFLDEPLHHAHTVQLLALSQEARRYVKVVLTGEGADEIFAGYPRYQIPLLAPWFAWMSPGLRGLLRGVGERTRLRRFAKLMDAVSSVETAVVTQARFSDEAVLRKLGGGRPLDLTKRLAIYRDLLGPSALETVLAYDRATYMQSLLQRLDRTTMAHGLEARVPFLDHRLVAWSQGLRSSNKMPLGRDNKVVLKSLARSLFPAEIVDRRKMGFDVPLHEWFRDQHGLGSRLDVLTDSTFASRGYCDAVYVSRLVDEHRKGVGNHADALWPVLNLELWMRKLIEAR